MKDFFDKVSEVMLCIIGAPLLVAAVFGFLLQFNWLWRLLPEGTLPFCFVLWLVGGVPFVLWRNYAGKKETGVSKVKSWLVAFFVILVCCTEWLLSSRSFVAARRILSTKKIYRLTGSVKPPSLGMRRR